MSIISDKFYFRIKLVSVWSSCSSIKWVITKIQYNIIFTKFIWGFFMDRYAMMLPEERRVVIAEKLRLSREGVYLTLNELISAGVCLNTPRIPIQLELPLGWDLSSTQEPLLRVSEPCTSQMQFQS